MIRNITLSKLLNFLVIFLFTIVSFSQTKEQRQQALDNKKNGIENLSGEITVNGFPLKDIDAEYSQIVGTSKLLSAKVTIQIDFGQERTFFGQAKATQLTDENGTPIIFTSMIDALNFMNDHGYGFVHAYAITMGNQNVYHYLLRRKREE